MLAGKPALLAAIICSCSAAGVEAVVFKHIIPAAERFAFSTRQLAEAAGHDCAGEGLREPYNRAYDDWMGLSHLRIGPVDDEGLLLAISFWPDERGFVDRTLRRLLADEDARLLEAFAFSKVSVAGRGLPALELMLYDDHFRAHAAQGYGCRLLATIASDLAANAKAILGQWQDDDYVQALLSAGDAGNQLFADGREARRILFTALVAGLRFNVRQRIGRPRGRLRPESAQGHLSGRSRRNMVLALAALREMAAAMTASPNLTTEKAFAHALAAAGRLDDEAFATIAQAQSKLALQELADRILLIEKAVNEEIGAAWDVAGGFNSSDGD